MRGAERCYKRAVSLMATPSQLLSRLPRRLCLPHPYLLLTCDEFHHLDKVNKLKNHFARSCFCVRRGIAIPMQKESLLGVITAERLKD